MIFKKPYAFFIKHFKFIHLIMLIFLCLIFYRFNIIREFLNSYVGSTPTILAKETVNTLFTNYSYIWFSISTLASIIILVVMNKKDKPAVYYAVTILVNIIVFIYFTYSKSIIFKLQEELLDQRILRGLRDIGNILSFIQIVILLIMLIRAIGFDIKKFDFVKDLQELDIDVKDNEEFEVSLDFDSNDYRRKIKKRFREFKYYVLENLKMIILVLIVFVSLLIFFLYSNFWKYTKNYKMNNYFNTPEFDLSIVSSYSTTKNYKLNKIIGDNKTLVIVGLNIKGGTKTLNTSKTILKVDNIKYYPINSKYNEDLIDIGFVYNGQRLSKEFDEYLLVYEIPIVHKDVVFTYLGSSGRTIFGEKYEELNVKLDVIPLDDNNSSISSKLETNLTFESSFINGNLFVNNYEMSNIFKSSYKKCINAECFEFFEYLQPSFNGYQDKTVLKMSYTLSYKQDSIIDDSFEELISKYGKIVYKANNNVYETKDILSTGFSISKTSPYIYIEIPKIIENADYIELQFNIRNITYSYVLKGE